MYPWTKWLQVGKGLELGFKLDQVDFVGEARGVGVKDRGRHGKGGQV